MATSIPCPTNHAPQIRCSSYFSDKNDPGICFVRWNCCAQGSSQLKLVLTRRLFMRLNRISRTRLYAAEADSTTGERAEFCNGSGEGTDVPISEAKTIDSGVRAEIRTVSDDELIPGAWFTGRVTSVQQFGAFVEFGAFHAGMVHVSNLCEEFVGDARGYAFVGQEVKVRILEVEREAKRISLSMKKDDDSSQAQRSAERKRGKKGGFFYKGQELVGTVKKKIREGIIISLPGGYESLLIEPHEHDLDFCSYMDPDHLSVGEEVEVVVAKIVEAGITVKLKKMEDDPDDDKEVIFWSEPVFKQTSPFLFAFRKSMAMMAYLKQRDKLGDLYQFQEKPDRIGRYDRKPEYFPFKEDPPTDRRPRRQKYVELLGDDSVEEL